MRVNLRSRAALMAAAAVGIVALSGCASGSAAPATSKEESANLSVWTWSNETAAALQNGILKDFEKAHPGITVTVVPKLDSNYETLLTTGLSGSSSPDVVAIRSYGVLQSFIDSGNITPLDTVVSSWKDFSPQILGGSKSRTDGKIYAVPQGVQTAQVYYNKDIFTKLGLSVPKTWNDFLADSKKIKDSGVAPIVIPGGVAAQTSLAAEIFGNARRGGNEFATKLVAGKTDLTSADNVASIQLMKDIQPYLVNGVTGVTLDAAVTMFATGQAAMFPSGTWEVATLKNLGANLNYGTFDVPVSSSWPSKQVTVSYADGGWALAKRSTHQKAAAELLNFFASQQFAEKYSNAMSTIPARSGVTLENPLLQTMYERYQKTASTYLGAAYLRYGTPSGTDLLGDAVQKMWLGQLTADQAAQKVQTGIDAWFKPSDFK